MTRMMKPEMDKIEGGQATMIAYGTGTFDARDFVRTGLVVSLAAMALLVLLALTYWPWMGYMTKPV